MDTEIVTGRLRLRRARPADFDALHALVSDYEVVKMTGSWPWPPDRDLTASRATPFDPEKGLVGPVFLGAELIGVVGVSEDGGNGDFGYMFARAHWGKGYATEMGRAVLAHAWGRYDWPVIEACVFEGNPASSRVLEKLGFTEVGACVHACAARGEMLPTRSFRLPRPAV